MVAKLDSGSNSVTTNMRKKDENKRIAIRDAAVAEVVKGGLSGATIARIANRAKLSQGTIYLYYPNKDALISQVYVEIKLMIRDVLMAHYDDSVSSAKNIRSVWFALLNFAVEHPAHFGFAETVAMQLPTLTNPELTQVKSELRSIIMRAISDGTLKSAPYESIQAVLVAPVTQLSRSITLGQQKISKRSINATFELIWRGIAL